MQSRKKRRVTLVAVPAVLAALGGCTTEVAGTAVLSTGAGAGAWSFPAVQLGDINAPRTVAELGAAFDPCDPSLWKGFPRKMVPPPSGDRTPRRLEANDPGEENMAICTFYHKAKGPSRGVLRAYIAWTPEKSVLKGKRVKVAGKPGVIKRKKGAIAFDDKGNPTKFVPRCDTRFKLSKGYGQVNVLNSKFPKTDVCAIAKSIGAYIVKNATK